MADLCNQCAWDRGLPAGTLAGRCARGNEMIAASCDGCGHTFVDADGNCLGQGDERMCAYRTAHNGEPGDWTIFHPIHGPTLPCECVSSEPPCSLLHAVFTSEGADG